MSASDALAACREAVARSERLREELRAPAPRAGGGGGRPGPGTVGDPTARAAEWATDGRAALHAELAACDAAVREGESVVRAVRAAFGNLTGDLAGAYYVRAMTWEAVGEAYGLPRRTAADRVRVAVEWADSAPPYILAAASGGFAGM